MKIINEKVQGITTNNGYIKVHSTYYKLYNFKYNKYRLGVVLIGNIIEIKGRIYFKIIKVDNIVQ